jgi:threonine dehydratase
MNSESPQSWETTKQEVNLQEIQRASERIRDIVPPTPVTRSLFQSQLNGLNVWFKLENFNVTGSFKIRGAANALRSAKAEDLKRGVVAASAGNHAQGVAYVSKILGVPAKIFMPERTPINKVSATRGYGATVILRGALYDDAYAAAIEEQKATNTLLVHAFGDTAVINGQGTAGLELMGQISDLGALVVPIGGGGLCGGMACAIKSLSPHVKIIGVQTTSFPSMKQAITTKLAKPVPAGLTIADGIAVKRPSSRTLALGLHYIDELILVSEDEIAAAIMSLMEKDHLLAEGAGAASVAALQKLTPELKKSIGTKPVCAVVSGGNIDVTLLSRIAARGLIASGRLMQIKVRTKDQPGQLAEILKEVSKTGANLIEVKHHRNFGAMYYSDVEIELELETTNFEHQEQIKKTLVQMGVAI